MYVSLFKRIFDIILAILLLLLLGWIMAIAAIAVKLTSPGPALYWSARVGRNEALFEMPKFRSMPVGTPAVATHLLSKEAVCLTPIGGFLRKSSIDELPQLWSIICGDMTFVGPRPALFNQDDLVGFRRDAGIADLRPGITGLAQISGRDDLTILQKVRLDAEYKCRMGLATDLGILLRTAINVIVASGVRH